MNKKIIPLIVASYIVVTLCIYFSLNIIHQSEKENQKIFLSETETDCQKEDIVNISSPYSPLNESKKIRYPQKYL